MSVDNYLYAIFIKITVLFIFIKKVRGSIALASSVSEIDEYVESFPVREGLW